MARDRDDDDMRDDEDDRPRRRSGSSSSSEDLGPLDKMFRDTNVVILVIFALCCGWIAALLSLICIFTAKDPIAKKNAKLVLIIGVVLWAIGILLNVVLGIGGAAVNQ